MEDVKNSGTAQSPRYSQSKSSSVSSKQQQQQAKDSPQPASAGQAPFARPHPLMAPQHTNTTTSTTTTSNSVGQSQSPSGAWNTTPSDWDSAPNITDTLEGTTTNGSGPDYHGGKSSGSDWDVKISPWDWEQMSNLCAPGRGGGGGGAGAGGEGAHSSKGSYTICHSSESGSIGGGGVGGGNRVTLPKIESDLGNGNGVSSLDSNRIVNLVVDRRSAQQQSSVTSIDDHRNRLLLGLGGVEDVSSEGRRRYCHDHCNGGTAKIGATDTMIGLKLGRREYFEDAIAPVRAGPTPYAVCPPGKKQRVQSPGVQVPRCQVDGCRQDLSSAKDYHRRHKVCEMHSKASRVMVAGLEQRFCQQCSRFHILTEFDEGKRSCRRRLAGHNERRRKPQPESAAIASTGSSAALHAESESHATSFNGEEDKRGTNGSVERGCYLSTQRTPGSSSTSVEENSDDQSGSMGTTLKLNQGRSLWQGMGGVEEATGLACQVPCRERQQPFLHATTQRMLTVMQTPKGVHQFMLEGSGGPGLTLASTSGTTTVLSTLETPSSPSVSGLSDSGRALSLLSSQAWGSRGGAPGSVSLDLSSGPGVALLDQLISEKSGGPFSPRRQQAHFHATSATAETLFPLQPHSVRVESREQHHRGFISGMNLMGSGFDGSVLALMQGNPDFLSSYGVEQRPTIDLMRLPSPQAHSSSTHASAVQSAEFSALRSFESFESLL